MSMWSSDISDFIESCDSDYGVQELDVDCLNRAIARFVELCPRLAQPEVADGACVSAHDMFTDLVMKMYPNAPSPVEAVFVSDPTAPWPDEEPERAYADAEHDWYLNPIKWSGHTVSRVGDVFIDFTARQFHPDAPFPLVFKLKERQQ